MIIFYVFPFPKRDERVVGKYVGKAAERNYIFPISHL